MRISYLIVGITSSIATAAYIMFAIWARYHRIAVLNDRDDIQGNFLIGLTLCAGLIALPIGFGLGVGIYAILERLWLSIRFHIVPQRVYKRQQKPSWITPFVENESED
ncbi:MAG: hypothetical protein VX966_05935 [Chloroflexota bacterium]|nr:hypothetical protein [Chloroflexota bacterium]